MDLLYVIFIPFVLLSFLLAIKYIKPGIARRVFPSKEVSDFLKANIIDYKVINYTKSPFYKKSLTLYLNHLLPSIFYPYYMFYYYIEVNQKNYWMIYKKSLSSIFTKNDSSIKIYSKPLELLETIIIKH